MTREQIKTRFSLSVLSVFIMCSFLYSFQVDPFYSRLLKKGEQHFLDQNYKEAVQTLKIAAFGLKDNQPLLTKTHILLSLSFINLKDTDNSKKYAAQAARWIDNKGYESLNINDSIKADFDKLLLQLNLVEKEEVQEETISLPADKSTRELEKELKREIRNNSKDVKSYFQLYELYRKNKEFNKAKRTLKKLVKNNPDEYAGASLLGKIYFNQNNYRKASQYFEKILLISMNKTIDRDALIEAEAFLSLCYFHMKDSDKLLSLLSQAADSFTQKNLENSDLDDNEINKLHEIIDSYEEHVSQKSYGEQIKELEDRLNEEPRNSLVYYDLYELYRKTGDPQSAWNVLKKLVENIPGDLRGHFLLAKTDFLSSRYKDSLEKFKSVLDNSEDIESENTLVMKSLIYVAVCYFHLKKNENMETVVQYIVKVLEDEQINNLVKEEGLDKDWSEIMETVDLMWSPE